MNARPAPKAKPHHENEVKIAAADAETVLDRLRRAGFETKVPRVLENNIVLDNPQSRLRANGLLLRVRTAGDRVTVTFKGKELPGVHKRREEREYRADDLGECLGVFEALGYPPSYRYEKYRTEFARPDEPGHVTLDETPIGVFVELEGPARWLDRTAKELGYSRADYITESYARLFGKWCAEYGVEARDMTFEATAAVLTTQGE